MNITNDKKLFKVDLHTHILPKHWPDLQKKYGYSGWISLDHFSQTQANMMLDGKNFRTIDCNCWSSEQRLKEMSETSVDVQVLSTVPVMFSYWAKPQDCLDLARYLNDHIAGIVAEDPKRFVGLGTLPMQDPEMACLELRRCMLELGLKGVQIGSHVNSWNLDAPELDIFWKTCEELDAAVFVHPWDMPKENMEKYWFRWLIGMPCETTLAICSLLFSGKLEKYPKLKVCFAHGGGSFPGTLGRIDHGFECRPDLCQMDTKQKPSSFTGKFWVDSLVHDEDTLQFLVKKMGNNRIILGSDYPFPLGEQEPGKIVLESSLLDQETKARILSFNAFEFLNMKPEDYLTDEHLHPKEVGK